MDNIHVGFDEPAQEYRAMRTHDEISIFDAATRQQKNEKNRSKSRFCLRRNINIKVINVEYDKVTINSAHYTKRDMITVISVTLLFI